MTTNQQTEPIIPANGRLTINQYDALREWASDPRRKTADLAFMSGLLRDVADSIHGPLQEAQAEIQRLKDELSTSQGAATAEARFADEGNETIAELRKEIEQLKRHQVEDDNEIELALAKALGRNSTPALLPLGTGRFSVGARDLGLPQRC